MTHIDGSLVALVGVACALAPLMWWLMAADLRKPGRLRAWARATAREQGHRLDRDQLASLVAWRERQVRLGATGAALGFAVGLVALAPVFERLDVPGLLALASMLAVQSIARASTPLTHVPATPSVRVAGLQPRSGPIDVRHLVAGTSVLLACVTALVVTWVLAPAARPTVVAGVLMLVLASAVAAVGHRTYARARTIADESDWQVIHIERVTVAAETFGIVGLCLAWSVTAVVLAPGLAATAKVGIVVGVVLVTLAAAAVVRPPAEAQQEVAA